MRKCNVEFNRKRGGFPRHPKTGAVIRAAQRVAHVTADKGMQLMQNTLLQCLCLRFGTFKVPMNKKDAAISTEYSGPANKTVEVFA